MVELTCTAVNIAFVQQQAIEQRPAIERFVRRLVQHGGKFPQKSLSGGQIFRLGITDSGHRSHQGNETPSL